MKKSLEQAALEMSQAMLETIRSSNETPLTVTTITSIVDQVLTLTHLRSVGPDDRLAIIRELEIRYSVWIGQPTVLENNDDHKAWLTPDRRKGWRLWTRYRRFLERKLSTIAVDALDEATNGILERLEDPMRDGAWDRRGMVVGHVQSGKTSSYTGLICKAVDAGYKVVVVLAGIHNNLRSQTQMRLDEGFLGYETMEAAGNQNAANIIGVGEIEPNPGIKLDYVTSRHDKGDFNQARGKHFGINPGGHPLLFVVKKNGRVLGQLLKWIDRSLKGHDVLENVPLLVIDDEADHASVDTKEQSFDEDGRPDEDHNPTTINRQIRQLLRKFQKSAYVGYTATPFANIYIHERGETSEEGPDLFPRSFIMNLPAPSNYDGPVRIFGLEPSDDATAIEPLPLVRIINDHVDGEEQGWMPPTHKKEHRPRYRGENTLPPTLVEAIRAFVLVCAARRARGQLSEHNSMLIHVTRFTGVQGLVRLQVEEMLNTIRRRIRYDSGGNDSELGALRKLWDGSDESFVPTTAKVEMLLPGREFNRPQWADVSSQIRDAAESIQVRTINGKAEDILDYETHKEIGFNVIAVGGDKLARGLTLEGLSVSYFLRASKMYDTLMQMGRWFGYRPGYLDLCRLYMTKELHDWFCHITEASEELRREFDHMRLVNGTPKDYGLKVRSHPEMIVTSQVKMRHGTEVEIDFAGAVQETIVFHRKQEQILNNLDASSELVRSIGRPSETDPTRTRADGKHGWEGAYYWSGIPAARIVQFLRAYRTHPEAVKANSLQLAEYIELKTRNGELTSWDVALLSGETEKSVRVGGLVSKMFVRNPRNRFESDKEQLARGVYIIRRLLNPRDEAIDLAAEEYAEALADTKRAWQIDPGRSRRLEPPDSPSGAAIRAVRGRRYPHRGLLLLYPLSPDASEIAFDGPIMGFGISFPGSKQAVSVKYTVNNVYWEQEYAGGA